MRTTSGTYLVIAVAALIGLALAPVRDAAAAPEKVRIAVVVSIDDDAFTACLDAFQRHLLSCRIEADYDIHHLQAQPRRAARVARKLAEDPPTLIFTLGTLALEAIAARATQVPIVATFVMRREDLQGRANVTGIYLEFPFRVQFEWMRRLLPQTRTVGVVYNPAENRERIARAEAVAKRTGLTLKPQKIESPRALPAALANLTNEADVLWGLSDAMVLNPQTAREVLLFSLRNRIPFAGLSAAWAKAGALYALDRDYRDIGSQCGQMAQALLAGRAIAELPPVPPRTVEYFLNLKTARRMKIDWPKATLTGAKKTY